MVRTPQSKKAVGSIPELVFQCGACFFSELVNLLMNVRVMSVSVEVLVLGFTGDHPG